MLIDKNNLVAPNDIVSLKLVSGDELVGKFLDHTTDGVVLGKPLTAVLQPMGGQQMGLSFMPVLSSVEPDTTLTIPITSIAVRPVKCSKQVAASYIKMTSGLITPSGNEMGLLRT